MAKAAEILEIPATITERGQTTVPAIRKMLALGKRDQMVFRGLAARHQTGSSVDRFTSRTTSVDL
jgi:hypothetical protein